MTRGGGGATTAWGASPALRNKREERAGHGSTALTTGAQPRQYKSNLRRPTSEGRPYCLAEQVTVLLQIGPTDRAIREFHADAEAVGGQLLTIDHLAPGRTGVQGSNAYRVARLPGLLREYAGAVRADVIGEGLLSIGRRAYQRREAHHDYDWQPPFYSASAPVVQRISLRRRLGKPEAWRRADSVCGRSSSSSGTTVLTWRGDGSCAWSGAGALGQATGRPPSATSRPYSVAFVASAYKRVKTLVL